MGKRRLVYNGKIMGVADWNTPKHMRSEVEAVFMGERVRITIEAKGRPKTYEQLGFYWAGILPAIAYGFYQIGNPYSPHDKDDLKEIHEFLVDKFSQEQGDKFSAQFVDVNSQVHRGRGRVSAMDKEDLSIYESWCIDFAQEFLGVTVPSPDDLEEREMFEKELAKVPEFIPKFTKQ